MDLYNRNLDNPFDLTAASNFTNSQILEYWVDLADGDAGLKQIFQPTSITPMIIRGSKGSGKTHLMRYFSADVQKMLHGGSLLKTIQSNGFVAMYIRAEGINSGRFAGNRYDNSVWNSIFCYYYEMWLCIHTIDIIKELLLELKNEDSVDSRFVVEVQKCFDVDVSEKFSTVQSFADYLQTLKRQIDFTVTNSPLKGGLEEISLVFSPGKLIFGLSETFGSLIPCLSNINFVYLTDEIENFSEEQQLFLNSLIRYRRGRTTFKLGARLYGLKTQKTLWGSGEPIRDGNEFKSINLDRELYSNQKMYYSFAKRMIVKRLSLFGVSKGNINEDNVHTFFDSIDSARFYQDVTLDILKSSDSKSEERPYFKKFREKLHELCECNEIIDVLKQPEFPLIEKLNIMTFYKEYSKESSAPLALAKNIAARSEKLVSQHFDDVPEHYQVYKHFCSDLLAQLYRDCLRRPLYSGLDTLIHLSQGVPRRLLGILQHIYGRALFASNKIIPFIDGTISIQTQTEGVMDAASWFWDDAQPDTFGFPVRVAVERLAQLFRTIRYSDKPSECKLCTFSVDISSASEESVELISRVENWSYIIKIGEGSSDKNENKINAKYQLNPLLAPKWGISIDRGGTVELKNDLCEAIFGNRNQGFFLSNLNSRVKSMNFSLKDIVNKGGQLCLLC